MHTREMANSTKTQDSFESCYSCIFENSQDSQVDSIHETLNNKVFLLPSSYNDIWLVSQLNQLKLSTSGQVQEEGDDGFSVKSEDESVFQKETFSCFFGNSGVSTGFQDEKGPTEDGSPSNGRLSDIVRSRLLLSSSKSVADARDTGGQESLASSPSQPPVQDDSCFLSEEDTIIIAELVKDSSVSPVSVSGLFSNHRFTGSEVGVCDGNNGFTTVDSISNSTGNFTQEEIDGIKEILSQEC